MSCRLHGYPWISLATSPYRSSPPAGLQGYILYPHIAAVCMYELVVLLLLGHMWGVHWSTSLMSSSLFLQQCPACLVHLTWIVFVMGGRWPYSWCLWGVATRTCSILLATFMCNCRLTSSPVPKLNYWYYIAILGTIWHGANKPIGLNRFINVK